MEFFGLDEATEAQPLEMENEIYDEIFKTAVLYTAGAPVAPGALPEAPVENQKPTPMAPRRRRLSAALAAVDGAASGASRLRTWCRPVGLAGR